MHSRPAEPDFVSVIHCCVTKKPNTWMKAAVIYYFSCQGGSPDDFHSSSGTSCVGIPRGTPPHPILRSPWGPCSMESSIPSFPRQGWSQVPPTEITLATYYPWRRVLAQSKSGMGMWSPLEGECAATFSSPQAGSPGWSELSCPSPSRFPHPCPAGQRPRWGGSGGGITPRR